MSNRGITKSTEDESLFTAYMRDVNAIPRMTDEEETETALRAAKGDKAARDRMVEANLRLVVKAVSGYTNTGLDRMDLIQAGNTGLMRAAEKFDPTKGNRFSTVAMWWIKQAVGRTIEEQCSTIRVPAHIHERAAKLARIAAEFKEQFDRTPDLEELSELSGLSKLMIRNVLNGKREIVSLDDPLDRDSSDSATRGEIIPDDSEDMTEHIFKKQSREALGKCLALLPEREGKVLRMRYGIGYAKCYTLDEVGAVFGFTRERARQVEADAMKHLRAPELMGSFLECA